MTVKDIAKKYNCKMANEALIDQLYTKIDTLEDIINSMNKDITELYMMISSVADSRA